MNYSKLAILGVLSVLPLAGFVTTGCAGKDVSASTTTSQGDPDADSATEADGSAKEQKKEEAVPVEVAALDIGAIESVLRFSSNLEAESAVQVFSQSKRLVRQLLVEEGDRVQRDQVLLRLEDDEQRSAIAKVESQLAKARREYQRQKRLFEQELISEQVFNDATYELDQLEISLDDAQRELGYTEVRAPIAGTVTSRQVSLGDQIQIGQHLFDIVDFNSIVARIFVPEKHLAEMREGLDARLSGQSVGNHEYTGRVKRIAPVVDPRSGTVKVTVEVGWQRGLRPGMYVDVDLVTATRSDAVLVPKRALVYDNDQMFVFRLGEARRVERVFIQPALSDKDFVQPREGLERGDTIVVAGQAGLKDKALVKLPGDEDPSDPSEASEELAANKTQKPA